ncbi:MAG: DHA2 family efflux MFS transporter permease subunit [Polyangiaceae bacterium]|nr:DHA2 family efflux MFS transporter permease subunit [Polyangiaceae bacterium]
MLGAGDGNRAAGAASNKWIIAVSVTFGTMMGAIDASIVNVAMSHIRGSLGASVEEVTWLSTAFILSTVLVMPLAGFLGRRFGQKRVYLGCLTVFVAASALCAVAPTFASLVVFRALQGLGAGALQPIEQAILRQTFPPEEYGVAMGVFSVAVGIGPASGPTLGGWIVDNFHWPWIFLINVPVGLVGLLAVARFVPPDEGPAPPGERGRLDWQGIGLLWATLLALQFVLEEGQRYEWFDSPLIVILSLTAAFGAAAFAIRELTAPSPAVNLRVFRDPTYAVGSVANAIAMAVLLSGTFLLPLFMQELLGYSAMNAGMAQLPRTLVMMVAMPVVGKLYNRVPPRAFVFAGLGVTAAGQLLMARLTLQSVAADAVLALVLQGLGMSMVIVPLSTLSLSRVPKAELGDAAGLAALLRQVGVSMGLAILASLLSRSAHQMREAFKWQLVLERLASGELVRAAGAALGDGAAAVGVGPDAQRALAAEVARQGSAFAFQNTFVVGVLAYLLLLPVVWFVRAPRKLPEGAAHTEPLDA